MLCLSVRAQLLRNRTLCPTYTRSHCIFGKWRMCVFMTIYVLSCGVNAAVQNVPTDMQIRSCGCANVHICACSHACLWRSVTDCTFISVLWLFSKWAAGSRRAWQQADVQASFWRGEDIHSERHAGAFGGCDHWCLIPVFSGAECTEMKVHTVYQQC